jgi:hypothetical protein
MEDLEKCDHNKKAVSNIIDLMLNDDYLLGLLLDYNRLIYVTDGIYEKHLFHVNLLEYKIDLGDCLDIENLKRMKNVSIIAVQGEIINEELTREVLIRLGGYVQAIKRLSSVGLDDFIMCYLRKLSDQILEDVIKQKEKREKA